MTPVVGERVRLCIDKEEGRSYGGLASSGLVWGNRWLKYI